MENFISYLNSYVLTINLKINGICVDPDLCLCDEGYRPDYNETDNHICHPICDSEYGENDGCVNSTCIAPNTCECFIGFERNLDSNSTCFPAPVIIQMSNSIWWEILGNVFLLRDKA